MHALQTPSFKSLLDSGLSSSKEIQTLQQMEFPSSCGTVKGICSSVSYKQRDLIIDLPMSSVIKSSDREKGIMQLALNLIEEYNLGEASRFASYIALLPHPGEMSTPFHWTDDEIDLLAYPYIKKSIQSQRMKWRKAFEDLSNDKLHRNITYERFIWGMENVASRAFSGIYGVNSKYLQFLSIGSAASLLLGILSFQMTKNEALTFALGTVAIALTIVSQLLSSRQSSTILLPIVDSCNHQSSFPAASLALEPISSRFAVRANREIPAESQITISYGNRTNDDFLQFFGFVEVDNIFDRYVIPTPLDRLKSIVGSPSEGMSTKAILDDVSETLSMPSFVDSPVVITRGGIESWALGSLVYLREQQNLDVSGFEIEVGDDVIDTKSMIALKILIENEIARLSSHDDLHGTQTPHKKIIETFRKEKLRLLSHAAGSLQLAGRRYNKLFKEQLF